MGPEAPCPSADDLEDFALGRVGEAQIEPLQRHLEACPRCVETLCARPGEDFLVTAMHGLAGLPDEPEDGQILEMIRRMEGLLLPAPGPPPGPGLGLTPEDAAATIRPHLAPAQGDWEIGRLGDYRILRALGAGGMGVVLEAEDTRLGRRVALKVLRPALAESAGARARFLREARAAAALDCPHVLPVLHVGEDRGLPFAAMPLLEGETLEDRLGRDGALPAAEVVRLGRELAEGLAAVHGRGLVHRDLKPTNVWLEAPDGRVKILDFGLARAVEEDARLTQPGVILGTPAYMAPEQARGEAVDARSDLFSLGCVLYRAATGRPPFPGATAMHVLTALALDRPAPPEALNPALPPALVGLILRLLEKAPGDRPASAQAVLDALAAVERGEPAQGPAGPHGGRRRQRSKGWLAAVAAAVLLPTLAVAGYLAGPQVVLFATDSGELRIEADRPVRIVLRQDGREVQVIVTEADRAVTVRAGEYEATVTALAGGGPVTTQQVRVTRGGREVFRVQIAEGARPAPAGGGPRSWNAGVGIVYGVAFSPDGSRLAAAGLAGLKVWDVRTGRPAFALEGAPAAYMSVSYSPDGKTLLGGARFSVARLWDAQTGKLIRVKGGLHGEVRGVVFDPAGRRVASPTVLWTGPEFEKPVGRLTVWDATTGENLRTFPGLVGSPIGAAFSPDGRLLAAGSGTWDPNKQAMTAGDLKLWDAATGQVVRALPGHTGGVNGVAFSPDGRRLASASWDRTVRVWDASRPQDARTTGRELMTLRGHTLCVWTVAFSPDGGRLASASVDGTVRLWDARTGQALRTFDVHAGLNCLAFSRDGKLLATGDQNERVRIWDLTEPAP